MASKHEDSQQPNNSPLSQTRRSALKKMLVGTGVATGAAVLPDKWAKPIVDKVLVPAHAQTSDPCSYSITCEFQQEGTEDVEVYLIVDADYKCPPGVKPIDDPTSVMVDITTLSSSSSLPDWPCPGTKSVPLDSSAMYVERVFDCVGRDDLTSIEVKVEFQDQERWGYDSSTCSWPVDAK